MVELTPSPAPPFWHSLDTTPTWEAPNAQAAHSVARSAARAALLAEQNGLCVYCEQTITADQAHLDHIKPRSAWPQLTWAYDNLAVSCNHADHCGHAKGTSRCPSSRAPVATRFLPSAP